MLVKAVVLVALFSALASRDAYKLTSRALGRWVAGAGGCASPAGVALHAVVFAGLAWLVMRGLHARGGFEGLSGSAARRKSLRDRRKARKARYADAKARGDTFGMLRYNDNVGRVAKVVNKTIGGKGYVNLLDDTVADKKVLCPKGWNLLASDMCCEQWWPDGRKQRCKTLSTGKVWDRDWGHGWQAKKLGQK
jgi:hypothetical protein